MRQIGANTDAELYITSEFAVDPQSKQMFHI